MDIISMQIAYYVLRDVKRGLPDRDISNFCIDTDSGEARTSHVRMATTERDVLILQEEERQYRLNNRSPRSEPLRL